MMTTTERNRLAAGGLLLAASVVIGAASSGWSPAPAADAPLLNAYDAQPPLDTLGERAASSDPLPAPISDSPARAPRVDRRPAAPATATLEEGEPVEEALLVLEGSASWYSDALAGRRTASGEPYDPTELIAAHRALPFGTRLRVTNLENDRSVEVRVIDRGPFVAGRMLDLSRRAADQIGIIRAGHARVRVEVLEYPATASPQAPRSR